MIRIILTRTEGETFRQKKRGGLSLIMWGKRRISTQKMMKKEEREIGEQCQMNQAAACFLNFFNFLAERPFLEPVASEASALRAFLDSARRSLMATRSSLDFFCLNPSAAFSSFRNLFFEFAGSTHLGFGSTGAFFNASFSAFSCSATLAAFFISFCSALRLARFGVCVGAEACNCSSSFLSSAASAALSAARLASSFFSHFSFF